MEQKAKVEIHLRKESDRPFAKPFSNILKLNNIKFEIVIDIKPYNTNYPFFTINEKKICLKMLINKKRKGKL